jgi:hypothetical protein
VAVTASCPILAVHVAALFVVGAVASAGQPTVPDISDVVLRTHQRETVSLQSVVREHRFTAVVFFSSTCPCFAVHRGRLTDLVREMQPHDVRFLIVDSERHSSGVATPDIVAEEHLPILRDDAGLLARRLGAQFATETFVFDAKGSLRYRGGIDDDRKYLSPKPKARLRDALLSLLDGTAPPYATAKSLGCALKLM